MFEAFFDGDMLYAFDVKQRTLLGTRKTTATKTMTGQALHRTDHDLDHLDPNLP